VAGASCAEARLRAYEEIPAAFATGDADSVLSCIDAWRESCGSLAELVRIEVLTLLWADRFDEWSVDTRFVDHLAEIELRDQQLASVLADSTLEPFMGGFRFAEFSQALAADVARFRPAGSEEYLLARFYSGDHDALWSRVDVEPYASTLLGQVIAIRRRELDRAYPQFFLGGYAGLWKGTGDLRIVGERFTLGAQLGVRQDAFSLRLDGAFQIGKADTVYDVDDSGDIYGTQRFTGAAVAVEPALRLFRFHDLSFEATLAIGWAGVEALEAEVIEDIELPAVWIHTAHRALGANLRWEDDRRFVEFQLRRGWQDWGTGVPEQDLAGGAWEFRFVVGGLVRETRDERLREIISPPPPPVPPR